MNLYPKETTPVLKPLKAAAQTEIGEDKENKYHMNHDAKETRRARFQEMTIFREGEDTIP